jgi:hypothetical protein
LGLCGPAKQTGEHSGDLEPRGSIRQHLSHTGIVTRSGRL